MHNPSESTPWTGGTRFGRMALALMVAWSFLDPSAWSPALRAQPAPPVECWHGLQRLDPDQVPVLPLVGQKPAQAPTLPGSAREDLPLSARALVDDAHDSARTETVSVVPAAPAPPPAVVPLAVPTPSVVIPPEAPVGPAPARTGTKEAVFKEGDHSESQHPLPNAPTPVMIVENLEGSKPSFLSMALAQFLGTALALGAGLTGALLLWRRHNPVPPAVVRVEVLAPAMAGPVPTAEPRGEPVVTRAEPGPIPGDPDPTPPSPPTAALPLQGPMEPVRHDTLIPEEEKTFDLGPTFEEERAQRDAARRQAEEAVLLSVFEANRELRRRLATEDAVPTSDPEPAPGPPGLPGLPDQPVGSYYYSPALEGPVPGMDVPEAV